SALMLGASDARRLVYLVDDNILWDNKKPNDKNPIIKPAAIALENALFTVSPVTGILFFGECDESWTKVTRANLFLLFGLYRYLPTLPDPYVGKLKMWDRLFAAGIGGTRTGTTTTG